MKHYKVLISLNAENEADLKEIVEDTFSSEHPLELEWWAECQ